MHRIRSSNDATPHSLPPNSTCFRSSAQRRVFPRSNFLEVSLQLRPSRHSRRVFLLDSIEQLQRARSWNERLIHLRFARSAEIRERRIRQTIVKRAAGLVVFVGAALENGGVERMRSNQLIVARSLRIGGFSRVENAVVENERLWIGEMILRLAGAFRNIEEIRDDRDFLSSRRHEEENAHHAANLRTKAKPTRYLMPQKRATHNLHRQHVVLRRFSAIRRPARAYPFRISTTSPRNTVRVKSQTFTASMRQKFRKSCSPSNNFTAVRIKSTS